MQPPGRGVKSYNIMQMTPDEKNIIVDLLRQNGYVLLPRWRPEETTLSIGQSIGSVVEIEALLPRSNIPTVQTLKPQNKATSSNNRYSRSYGLDVFPLHTDLAHWVRPPRYFLLRCRNGCRTVATKLLTKAALASVLDDVMLRRALVRPRRVERNGILCLLPLVFYADDICGFRWDPLFLVPMNETANRVAKIMASQAWSLSESLTMAERGDTLIVDNWNSLHGRSGVSIADVGRRLERVYLSEVHE